MLYSLSYYYQKAKESGIRDLNCKVNVSHRNWVTNEVQSWPEVKTYFEFIDKCYSIASEVPFEQILGEFYIAKFCGKTALEKVHLKVVYWMNTLNTKEIEHKMGYTPVSHIREQLIQLWNEIDKEIRSSSRVTATPYTPAHESQFQFASLFG